MSQVGTIYGNALYDLCKEEHLQETVLSQLQMLSVSFQENPAFLQLLCAPNIPVQERCQVVDDCFRGKVEPYVLNFLKLLTEKMYVKQFASCAEVFQNLYNEENGILPVTAVTAVPLTQEQSARLTEEVLFQTDGIGERKAQTTACPLRTNSRLR